MPRQEDELAAKYRKVDPHIWIDLDFAALSTDARYVALYLLTSPQMNRIGLHNFSAGMATAGLCPRFQPPADLYLLAIVD